MPHFIAAVKYEGIARIAMKLDKEPKSFQPFRGLFQSSKIDMGIPIFKTGEAEIEELDRDKEVQNRIYEEAERLMKQNAQKQEAIFPKKKTIANILRRTARKVQKDA